MTEAAKSVVQEAAQKLDNLFLHGEVVEKW
jgi:hypothetical protein